MQWVHDTIADFGKSIGLPHLAVNKDKVACLELESMGDLFIELHGHEILIYLAFPAPPNASAPYLELLQLSSIRNDSLFQGTPVQVAATEDDNLIIALRLEAEAFNLPLLEEALDYLLLLAGRFS